MPRHQVAPPDADELRAYSLGKCASDRATQIEAFLADGPDCSTVLEATADDALVRNLRGCRELPGADTALPNVPGYDILGELGRGGMGVVYKARQISLKRVVALKMIRGGADAGPEAVARFRAEAEAVARLQHPNIVHVHEVGGHEGSPFFSLEFCGRGSLVEYLRRHPLTVRQAAGLVETLARAVHAAHRAGIVHRDLKPHNVLLAGEPDAPLEQCVPKIADFGLAKFLDDDSGRTRSGAVLGTPSYLAPEQAAGRVHAVGPATDVYGLGAILYECLTGGPPFRGATALETLEQVRAREPVPPAARQPAVPRDLNTICLKCLEKDAGRRYASAEELADDLRRFLDHDPIRARPVGAAERTLRWLRRRPAAVLAVALVALVAVGTAGGAWMWHRQAEADERARAELAANAVTVACYASLVWRNGEPEGVGPLEEEEAVHRLPGYRVHYRGGKVERIDVLNAHLVYNDHDSLPALLGQPAPQLLGFPRDASLLVVREADGRPAKVEARDPWGQLNWSLESTGAGAACFTDRRGSTNQRHFDTIIFLRLDADETGFVREIRLVDEAGRPRPTEQGVTAVRLERDGRGLPARCTYLDAQGQPKVNGWLPPVRTEQHDEHGDLTEEVFWEADGRPATWYGMHRKLTGPTAHGEWEEAYFDALGRPVAGTDGFHRLRVRVAGRGTEAEFAFFGADGKAVANRQGFHRFLAVYDEHGVEQRMDYLGPDGRPAVHHDPTGDYFRRTTTSDDRGNLLERSFWLDGPDGTSVLHFRTDARGNRTEEVALTADARPSSFDNGSTRRWTARYDARDHRVEQTYFDADGKPVTCRTALPEPHARATWSYDRQDRLVERAFWVVGPAGELRMCRRENGKGKIVEEAFFDDAGRPRLDPTWRQHRWTAEYDARGNVIAGANFGLDGEPVLHPEGDHRWTAKYDDHDNKIELSSFGTDGKPVVLAATGACRWTAKFDGADRRTEECFYGVDGRPVVAKYGYARRTWAYDGEGRLTEVATWGVDDQGKLALQQREDGQGNVLELALFDKQGRPAADEAGGFHRWTAKYDAKGRLLEKAYFGTDGRPVINRASGNHRWTSEYDARGNEVAGANFGVNGEPVLHRQGMHRWEGRFDDHDRQVEEVYFGTDGRPTVTKKEMAKWTIEYGTDGKVREKAWWVLDERGGFVLSRRDNGQGKTVERRWWTADGKPAADPTSGAHRVASAYDGRGNLVEQDHFGADGKPVLNKAVGTHKRTLAYDDKDRVVEVAHFGTDGRPMRMPAAGSHRWTTKYDERGNKVEHAYFDVDGSPVLNKSGYHKATYRYDEQGKEVERLYWDVEGKPVKAGEPPG
jgi:hypothetical protein